MSRVMTLPRMYGDQRRLKPATETCKGICFRFHNELGDGFLVFPSEHASAVVLAENHIFFQRQMSVPAWCRGQKSAGRPG